MSANLIPITSDGGFTTTGNVVVGGSITLTGSLVGTDASPAPSLSGFSSVATIDGANLAGTVFNNANISLIGGTGVVESSANNVSIYSDSNQLNGILFYGDGTGLDGVDIYAAQVLTVFANNSGDSRETRFYQNGSVSLSGRGYIYPSEGGDNAGLTLYDSDNNNQAELAAIGNVTLRSDSNNAGSEWVFDTNGDLTVPNYIYFKDGTFIGDEGGAAPPVFRVDSPLGLGINLTTDSDISGNNYTWSFGIDGNLNLPSQGTIVGTTPNNSGYLQWVGNSSGDGYGYTTLQLCPDNTLSSDQMIIIDPTAPNHIHIRAGGFQDNTSTQLFLGGENSYFSVGAGVDPSVYIAAADNQWTFGSTDGNLTLPTGGVINYANGTQYGGGGGSSYSNTDATSLLASFGSNTVSTTGNITGGNIIATANVLGSGYARFSGTFDESQASTSGLYLGHAGGTPRMMFGTGNTIQTFEIDNDGGTLRFYQPGSTKASLTSDGVFTAIGNVTGANILSGGNFALTSNAGRINFNTGAYITANGASLSREGSIILSPAATGTFPGVVIGGAGRLIAPNGGVFQIFNSSDVTFQTTIKSTVSTAATSTTTGALIIPGGIGAAGSITTGVGALLTGPTFTPLANTIAGFNSNVNSYTQLTFQNKSTGTDATADIVLTADNGNDTVNYSDFGIINSGYDNNTPTNSLGNIVYAADTYLYAQGNSGNTSQSGGNLAIGTTVSGKTVKIFAGGVTSNSIIATVSNTGVAVTGNVTASNFIGNISITGNVTGTSSNVTLVAGSYSATMDNTGYFSAPTIKITNSTGNEGGELQLALAPNATISGTAVSFDSYVNRVRIFEGGGNARGVYIDLSKAPDGVGGELMWKASGVVNAGVDVTLGNLRARIPTSGNRSLQVSTVSGTYSVSGSSVYYAGGAGGATINGSSPLTITTTPAYLAAGVNFSAAGYTDTWIIYDASNSIGWRITLVIGVSYANNMISIERLV